MTIDRILSIIATTVSFIAVPASGYLSYRFAVKGEKRKEYNAKVSPVRVDLIRQIDLINHEDYGNPGIERSQILSISDHMNRFSAEKLLKAFEEYQKANSYEAIYTTSPSGKDVIKDYTQAKIAAEALLSCMPRK